MSLIFIDGFDHYNAIRQKWQAAGSMDHPTFVAGRFGGQCVRKQFQNAQQTIRRSFDTQTEVFFGCALKTPGFPIGITTESIFRFEDASTNVIFSIGLQPSGKLSLSAGGFITGSVLALDNVQWNYIEAHYIPKDAAGKGGVAEVKVNGTVWVALDGTLYPTTTQTDDEVGGFGFMDDGTNSAGYLFDDLYILSAEGTSNNDYLGDVRITTMAANADGTNNDWTSNDVTLPNFNATDEVIMDSNTSYVESGLVGASEDYDNDSFAQRVIAPGEIYGVQVSNALLRTATGIIRAQNEMVIAGTSYTDGVQLTPGSGAYFIETWVTDTDPSDSLTWTEDKVAATGSGISITYKET